MKRSIIVGMIVSTLLSFSGLTTRAERFSFIWENGTILYLKSPGGSDKPTASLVGLEALDINDLGQVVGTIIQGDAFIWENGTMREIGLGGGYGRAQAINEFGQVVGSSWTPTGVRDSHAFTWKDGITKDLGGQPTQQTTAYGINDNGQIVGTYPGRGAFYWENGSMSFLFGGNSGGAYDINNSGQIVGKYYDSSWEEHAFVLQNDELTDLSSFGGIDHSARRINEYGQIIGGSTDKEEIHHSVLWENEQMIDLGTEYSAIDINNMGQILSNDGHLWENGFWRDLEIFDDNSHDIFRTIAINDHGQIVGFRDIDFQVKLTTRRDYIFDFLTYEDTFSFDYWWIMDQVPTGSNLDILIFRGIEWEILGWELTTDGSSSGWETATFWVPEWARGLETQVRFRLFDLGPKTDPIFLMSNLNGLTPSPEPSTMILLATGLIGLAGRGRRKFKK